ncbi:hypothetical protein CDD80_2527 [Ophiocordyceps camponoti-rufipedis]|uniref:ORP1 like protein n=1 Tax=Ophiocordyceps camponoti-rufipedis TaxID=2004952 RepID=A0A2C5Z7R8_9HYPO|nr:hypothetical protein CDD80_2527 [Ophiocordyceps camponoti-rufipedis]
MDVTLLLNQSAGFANRDAASRESTPPYAAGGLSTAPSTALPTPSPERCEPRQVRGRTPWNAGGYSLPLQSDSKFRSASTFSYRSARDQAESDASGHTARAPGGHSRHVSVDSDSRHRLSDSHSSMSSYSSRQSRPHSRISSTTTISGSYAGSSLAELPILESSLDERDEPRRRQFCGEDEARHVKRPSLYERVRPASPPDESTMHMGGFPRPPRHMEAPRPSLGRATHLLFSHKRAISAPDFASAPASRFPRPPYKVLPPPHQTMAMRERREAETAPTSGLDSSPELAKADDKDGEPRCMFVANCDTGSQLRKAISHLFGRNKSCTLKIPKEVWVYYCRKHYQRIRYRNARTYPSNQMELVKVQIRRLQAWSEANKAKRSGPCIKQWTLSLRKREQNRLEKGAGEEGDDEHGAHGGSVVPDWIIQMVGDGYTTDKMLEVAERLHKDISDGVLGQVPEIEFLPDIVDDGDGASKPTRSRRSNASSSSNGSKNPKRKADFSDLSSRQNSVDVGSPAVRDEDEPVGLMSPSGKRARLERVSERTVGPSYRVSMPPFMASSSSSSYNEGAPRAPFVVPKFRHMDFGNEGDEQSLPRFNGFQQPLYDDAGYGHRFGSPDDVNLTLPSIRTQMLPGAPRPMPPSTHQRSASAYTFAAARPSSTFVRSSSSHGPADQGAAVYDLASHHHNHGHHLSHGGSYHHAQENGWVEGYGHNYHHGPSGDSVSPCSGLAHGA